MLPCPTISPAHKLPTGSTVWHVVPHPPAVCSRILCLFTCQLCQLSIFSRQTASPGLSDSATAFTLSTGVYTFPSFLLPQFLFRVASISSQEERTVVMEAFALYIKIGSRICFYFPKSVSGIETLELRQRDEAGAGLSRVWGPNPCTSLKPQNLLSEYTGLVLSPFILSSHVFSKKALC